MNTEKMLMMALDGTLHSYLVTFHKIKKKQLQLTQYPKRIVLLTLFKICQVTLFRKVRIRPHIKLQ